MDRRNHKAGKGGVFFRRYLVFDPTMSFRGRSIDLRGRFRLCGIVLFCLFMRSLPNESTYSRYERVSDSSVKSK